MKKETINPCDTCAFKRSRVEMITPNTPGTVDYCKKGVDIQSAPRPYMCGLYEKSLKTKIKDIIL